MREAKILSQLTHPRICTLYELVEDGGEVYLAMEALQGESLATRLARSRDRGLPVTVILTTAAEIADGLAFAHERGFIHRDVKPSNILLTSAGAKILDFGIARLGEPGGQPGEAATVTTDGLARAGTLPYMAPEQLDGRANARSNLFSLGAVIFEMLTGHRSFDGSNTAAIVGQIVDERRPTLPSNLRPPGLVRLVDKCLAINPRARWQTASNLADELRWNSQGTGRRRTQRAEPGALVRPEPRLDRRRAGGAGDRGRRRVDARHCDATGPRAARRTDAG